MAPFRYSHRVTYAECTMGNHIYYARYLDLLEAARGELFRQSGKPLLVWQGEGVIFPVIECRLRYRYPARYDDVLAIDTWLTILHGVRMTFSYRISNQENQLVLEGETAHVCTGLNEKPKALPPQAKEILAAYLQSAKEGV